MSSLFRFLWTVVKPYKGWYALMLQAPLLTPLYGFANYYAIKLIIDVFSQSQKIQYSDLYFPIALFISAQILLDIIWRVSNIAGWKCEPYVRRDILLKAYDYVQYHSYQFFQDTRSGVIVSKLKGIMDGYDHLFGQLHHVVSLKLSGVIILTAVLAVVDIKIFFYMSIWAIVFSVVMYKMSLKLDRLKYEETESKHTALGFLSDNITNIFSLFSFSTRKYELKAASDFLSQEFVPKQIKAYQYSFKVNITSTVFYLTMLVSVFLFMIHQRNNNQASNGDFVFVIGITLKMSELLWEMIIDMQNLIKELGDFRSSFSILATPHDKTDQLGAHELIVHQGKIEFKNIQFSYGEKTVFDQLNILIRPGEKVGLVGLSGAGKSTLISILLRNFIVQGGEVLIDHQNVYDVTADSVRNNIALIPQDILLFHRTIFENIRYGDLNATGEEVMAAAKKANIHEHIMNLPEGYNSYVGERGVKLSGGQRQRIAIARAILKNSKILILDEATSSLDTEVEREIQLSINEVLEMHKSTVIAIAHRLSTLKHMDRIIVLDQGRVIEEGKHDDLIVKAEGLYKKLWDMQKV